MGPVEVRWNLTFEATYGTNCELVLILTFNMYRKYSTGILKTKNLVLSHKSCQISQVISEITL